MATFKDKTGRGEVNYTAPVKTEDGTIFFLDAPGTGTGVGKLRMQPFGSGPENNFSSGGRGHLLFQLRGEGDGVVDMSKNKWQHDPVGSITEMSGTLTKRMENVTQGLFMEKLNYVPQII